MGVAELGRRRRFAPPPHARIDWSHPLARGLMLCVVPGATLTDIATGVVGTRTGTTYQGSTAFGSGVGGVTASTPTNYIDWGNCGDLTGRTSCTVTWAGQLVTAGASTVILSRWGTGGNQYLFYISGGTTINFAVQAGSTTIATGPSVASGEHSVFCGVRNGTTAIAYKNGVPGTAATPAATAFASTTATTRVFNKNDDSLTSGEAIMSFAAVHSRPLSAAEVTSFSTDPFQMLVW